MALDVECFYAESRDLFIIMLNVVMLSVVMLIVVMLNVVMLNVVMLNAVMLNVVMLNVVMLNVVAKIAERFVFDKPFKPSLVIAFRALGQYSQHFIFFVTYKCAQ